MGMLLLVRHGQASFGSADYDVLSSTGRTQARRLGAYLATDGLEPSTIVHGGMRRQEGTAEELVSIAGWDVGLETDERWAEFDHLAVLREHGVSPDGLDRREFQQLFEAATTRWQAESPGWGEFLARVRSGLEAATAQAGPRRTAVVVTSGGVIAAVAATLLGDEDARSWQRFNAVVVNSSVTRVVVGSTGPRLLTFNEHAHLEGELVTYR